MQHWKLTLSYDGTHFHGWQVQPGLMTVQSSLAEAIERVTGGHVLPQGSGRTDAGVHALAQVASFALASLMPAPNLLRALNRVLPSSVRVLAATPVAASFHARHSALAKIYEYRIFERRQRTAPDASATERICSPFLAPFVWDCRWPLSLETMQDAATLFLGTHDFTSFAASDPERGLRDEEDDGPRPRGQRINPVKTITHSNWSIENGLLVYRIRGNGFLHHMVRNIVGTLVDIGRGSLTPGDVGTIMAARDRTRAGPTAPARGLYLHTVEYDPRYADAPSPEASA